MTRIVCSAGRTLENIANRVYSKVVDAERLSRILVVIPEGNLRWSCCSGSLHHLQSASNGEGALPASQRELSPNRPSTQETPLSTQSCHTVCTIDLHSRRRSRLVGTVNLDRRRANPARDASRIQETHMAAVDEKVKQIIVEQLQVDEAEVTPNASFQEDLGADSLDVVELVMQFEEAFDIQIPDEDAEKIKTVKDAVDYIEKNQKGK